MSNYLNGLNKTELKVLVENFQGIPRGTQRKHFVDALIERQVSDEEAKKVLDLRKEELMKANPNYQESPVGSSDNIVLVRMRRANPRFQWRDYNFTTADPFVMMKQADAEALMTFEKGFFIATPQEAREYYGSN